MDQTITEALLLFNRFRSDSVKIENEMLEIITATRLKIIDTRAAIVTADCLLDDFRKVWARQ